MSSRKINVYNPNILSIYEIIGSYFVNQFYTTIFVTAKKKFNCDNKKSNDLTDMYKSLILTYLSGILKTQKYYSKVCLELLRFFQDNTKYKVLSLNDFINKIVMTLLPDEFYNTMTDNEKAFFLHKFIIEVIQDFTKYIVKSEHLSMAIDNRSEMNAKIWKEQIVQIQLMNREKIYLHFIEKQANLPNSNDSTDMVPIATVHHLRNTLTTILREKCTFECNFKKSLVLLQKMDTENKAYMKLTSELKLANNNYQLQINSLETKLLELQQKFADIKHKKIVDQTDILINNDDEESNDEESNDDNNDITKDITNNTVLSTTAFPNVAPITNDDSDTDSDDEEDINASVDNNASVDADKDKILSDELTFDDIIIKNSNAVSRDVDVSSKDTIKNTSYNSKRDLTNIASVDANNITLDVKNYNKPLKKSSDDSSIQDGEIDWNEEFMDISNL